MAQSKFMRGRFFFAEVLVLAALLISPRGQVCKKVFGGISTALQNHAARNLMTPNSLDCSSTKPLYANHIPHRCGLKIGTLQPYSLT